MSFYRKNNGYSNFFSQSGLAVIIAVFFILPFPTIASQNGHGVEKEKNNFSLMILDKVSGDNKGLKKAFNQLDSNSDDRLTVADFEPDMSELKLLAAIPFYRKIIPALILESQKKWYTYAKLDTNGDGQVDFKEFRTPRTNIAHSVWPR